MFLSITPNKKYGILLSGGIDSAILLYLLIKSSGNTFNLQPFTIAKADGAYLYADPIIEHFNKKFNLSIPKTIVVGDPTVYHRLQSVTAVKDIFQNYPVDYLYIGLNKNPPELANLNGAPQRTTHSTDPRIILPFADLYKHNILEFMYDNNQEDLIDITHSCTEQQQGRCNQCWQCTERAWAFRQLGKMDTGTL